MTYNLQKHHFTSMKTIDKFLDGNFPTRQTGELVTRSAAADNQTAGTAALSSPPGK